MTAEQLFASANERLADLRVGEAAALFDKAERAGFDTDSCAAGRWTCHMLTGNFERAWRESDAITSRGSPDPHRFWDGRPVEGRRVLVRCLHGLGDTIQFIRYAEWVRERAHSLTVEAQPELKPLLLESGIADQVLTWGEAEPPWDQQIEVLELPRIFRTTLDTIPAHVPYLRVTPSGALLSEPKPFLARVGVVWTSSGYNPARSIPIEQFARIFATPNIEFFSLQSGSARSEIEQCSRPIVSLCQEASDPVATAQALRELDLILTVDTMVAHLAGALGLPVWTMLPHECDWRWMLTREDSPWYPTMRLFRQPRAGDWDAVLDRIQRELQTFSARPRYALAQTGSRSRSTFREA